jgi:hypothetical protein
LRSRFGIKLEKGRSREAFEAGYAPALEGTREASRRELEALAKLERDRKALMERYAGTVSEDLGALIPEERHHVYKLLKLRIALHPDRTPEVSGERSDHTLQGS